MNSRNPQLTSPSTPSTRASISRGSRRPKNVTAVVQPPSIRVHSSSDPSWLPQVAESR